MAEVIETTVDELDKLERAYAQKNKRKSNNIRNRISDNEKILLCYYEIVNVKTIIFSNQDVVCYILTDTKLICPRFYTVPGSIEEIRLDGIEKVTANPSGFLSSGSVTIETEEEGNLWIFNGVKDEQFLNKISDQVIKAIADFKFRKHSPHGNSTEKLHQHTVTEELERLANLRTAGVLTEDEFRRAKEKILNK